MLVPGLSIRPQADPVPFCPTSGTLTPGNGTKGTPGIALDKVGRAWLQS
jgi:hypothetical protein